MKNTNNSNIKNKPTAAAITNNDDPLQVALKNSQRRSTSRRDGIVVGPCGHFVICLLPILGGALVLLVLAELLQTQEITIYEMSISDAMADYTPYLTILIPTLVGATIIVLVTLARNIQIGVYYRRQEQSGYSWLLRMVNGVGALVHITGYAGFVMLVVFQIGGGGREEELHILGAIIYFVCSSVYGTLHTILLWRQSQYPVVLRLLLALVAAAGVVATVGYGLLRQDRVEYEWYASGLAAIYVMLFAALFHVDPVDDELAAFCCCRRSSSSQQRQRALL
jgi:Frag1/DRAM/Sfk1 family